MFFPFPYFTLKLLFLLHLLFYKSLWTLTKLVGRIFFRYSGRSTFVSIGWLFPGIFLNLPSFAKIFWFISSSCVVRHVCVCRFGVFLSVRFLYVLSSLTVSLDVSFSLFVLVAPFPIQGRYFCSDSFVRYLFYHWLLRWAGFSDIFNILCFNLFMYILQDLPV